jgi:hypothetical protein
MTPREVYFEEFRQEAAAQLEAQAPELTALREVAAAAREVLVADARADDVSVSDVHARLRAALDALPATGGEMMGKAR